MKLSAPILSLIEKDVPWLDPTPDSEIALGTRIRLARNLAGLPFPDTQPPEIAADVAWQIKTALQSDPNESWSFFDLPELSPEDREILYERRLISAEFREVRSGRLLALSEDSSLSIMINEEDHLRIQGYTPGIRTDALWERVSRLDDRLAKFCSFAYSSERGFLTSCPTNLGTGLRVSVMLHLPGIVVSDLKQAFSDAASDMGMTLRSFTGENEPVTGNLYQISNQTTLGESENDILSRVHNAAFKVLEREELVRKSLLQLRPDQIYNVCGRAYGLLRHSYLLSSAETMDALSPIRLGIDLKLFEPQLSLKTLNDLLVFTQPWHLCVREGFTPDPQCRARKRAALLRRTLGNNAPDPQLQAPES